MALDLLTFAEIFHVEAIVTVNLRFSFGNHYNQYYRLWTEQFRIDVLTAGQLPVLISPSKISYSVEEILKNSEVMLVYVPSSCWLVAKFALLPPRLHSISCRAKLISRPVLWLFKVSVSESYEKSLGRAELGCRSSNEQPSPVFTVVAIVVSEYRLIKEQAGTHTYKFEGATSP